MLPLRRKRRSCGNSFAVARLWPGVEEVAVGDPATIPLDQSGHELNILEGHFYLTFEGQNVDQQKPTVVQRARVTPEYFHLLGLTLVRGHLFNKFDKDTAPTVAVGNAASARSDCANTSS